MTEEIAFEIIAYPEDNPKSGWPPHPKIEIPDTSGLKNWGTKFCWNRSSGSKVIKEIHIIIKKKETN
jgi:hypothetical protein